MILSEKRKNWLEYHKWLIVIIVILLVCTVSFISSIMGGHLQEPDFQIVYVGLKPLPDDTVAAVEKAFTLFGSDVSGDGEVKVSVSQYIIGKDALEITQLMIDLTAGESCIYLVEDPGPFQEEYGVLGYADGTFGTDSFRNEPLWYPWDGCPELATLELGKYAIEYDGVDLTQQNPKGDNQELLAELYIGRRGYEPGDE